MTRRRPGDRGKQGKGGKRPDLDDQYFRSRWEANYARYLRWLVQQGEIKSWKFEPDEFEFVPIKRGTRFYKPDFKITENDDTVVYHEIKGYMDAKSQTQLDRMARYHPTVKVVVIDGHCYRDIQKKVGYLIPEWEWPA